MTLKEHFEQAIQYVRDNQYWSREEEFNALKAINHYRCRINEASPKICRDIRDLMNDYTDEESLEKDWWREFGDEDDIYWKL